MSYNPNGHLCPMCGRKHHAGTTVGFTRMTRSCYRKWEAKQKREAHKNDIPYDRRRIASAQCKGCPHTRASHSHTGKRCFGKDCDCEGFAPVPETTNWAAPDAAERKDRP